MSGEVFDTTGMDSTTLQHAALLLSQAWGEGRQATVTGPNASQLTALAGSHLTGVTLTDPNSAYGNMLTAALEASPGGLPAITAALGTTAAASAASAPTAATKWVASIAGNWLLIGIGVTLAIAALVISQRKPIGKVIDVTKKTVGKVAEVAALAA